MTERKKRLGKLSTSIVITPSDRFLALTSLSFCIEGPRYSIDCNESTVKSLKDWILYFEFFFVSSFFLPLLFFPLSFLPLPVPSRKKKFAPWLRFLFERASVFLLTFHPYDAVTFSPLTLCWCRCLSLISLPHCHSVTHLGEHHCHRYLSTTLSLYHDVTPHPSRCRSLSPFQPFYLSFAICRNMLFPTNNLYQFFASVNTVV